MLFPCTIESTCRSLHNIYTLFLPSTHKHTHTGTHTDTKQTEGVKKKNFHWYIHTLF